MEDRLKTLKEMKFGRKGNVASRSIKGKINIVS